MLSEDQLIPYQPSPLPSGPWLVFAPHPDDEVFGMAGAIAQATQAGIVVEVVVLSSGDQAGDPALRRQESEAAGALLGVGSLHFWNIPDRQLADAPLPVAEFERLLASLQPATVFLPGLQEYHPDHRAATLRLSALLRETGYGGALWLYEISRHNEANCLVDITGVLSRKREAIGCFRSQLACNDYEGLVLGINRSRAYSLPASMTHAEAFWVMADAATSLVAAQLDACRRYWQDGNGAPRPLVSIIVRTKDRPHLLREAIASIARQSYQPIEVVVVNDGGADVESICREATPPLAMRHIALTTNVGRAAAANVGLRAATGEFVGFLDDDDLYLPEAIETLVTEALAADAQVVYGIVDLIRYDGGGQETHLRRFETPFDPHRLLFENFVPTNALLFRRQLLDRVGLLDEAFTIFEDWEFVFRLSQQGSFRFIRQPVAIYRDFCVSTASGSRMPELHAMARQAFYRKHWASIDPAYLGRFYDLTCQACEARGNAQSENVQNVFSRMIATEISRLSAEDEARCRALAEQLHQDREAWGAQQHQALSTVSGQLHALGEAVGTLAALNEQHQARWEERWSKLLGLVGYPRLRKLLGRTP